MTCSTGSMSSRSSSPPLRERIDDIPILAEAFFQRVRLKTDRKINGISNDTMRMLMQYTWPGNVRELKSAFEYAFVTCNDTVVEPHHFPPSIYNEDFLRLSSTANGDRHTNRKETKKRLLIEALKKTKGNQSRAAQMLGISRVTVWNQIKSFGIDLKQML